MRSMFLHYRTTASNHSSLAILRLNDIHSFIFIHNQTWCILARLRCVFTCYSTVRVHIRSTYVHWVVNEQLPQEQKERATKKELANRSGWLVGWHLMVLSIKTDHTNLQWHIDNSQSINNTLHCILGRPGGGIILDPLKSRTTPLGRVRPLGSSTTLLGQVRHPGSSTTAWVEYDPLGSSSF